MATVKKRSTTKVVLTEPTTAPEATNNIFTSLEWAKSYVTNLTKYIEEGSKLAGKRARANQYNIKLNSGVISRSMKLLDEGATL